MVRAGRRRTTGTTVGRVAVLLLLLLLVSVLLDGVFSDTSDNGTTDGSEDPVIRLVTGKASRQTTGEGTTETTFTVLRATRGTLLVVPEKKKKKKRTCQFTMVL